MAEKGGKGFSLPKNGKSALKSPASKGKDDISAKSKRGRKVQFDSEGSLDTNFTKSNGKADQPSSKGVSGKGGKGEKAGSAGKSQTAKAPGPLELRVEQELPDNTACLMDCEAADILQGIQEQMVVLSEDPAIKLPISFDRGLTYAQRNRLYDNPEIVKQILKPLKEHGVSDGELCMIANFAVESVDEVFALVPSFKTKKSKLRIPLKNVLGELAKLRRPA
ncbi:DNA-directed RNA polymerases IV and V subunit 4 [Nicotiana tomentosiformis]|uniref:DNA-directed RNA polymerases IV and V subunit 4 n=1 Tax=Nicotiana tomentosiformis TaxID=4098 RepID=UPI00051C1257|nr:DNA-directed RNA polymerases IV and V subunit 4 [Nicotiana tomentosiformis]XP_009617771.1 DNA-directed RNA polymerases IV and V subunit 4 [Nicotiana tomentosiformis]